MIIKEFLPNPAGSDKEGEYIKILNNGDRTTSLNGWKLEDASGKEFILSGDLAAGEELVLPHSQTKIFLNNNGEEVLFFNPAGKLVDKLNYSGRAEEGQIIVHQISSITYQAEETINKLNNSVTNNLITNYQFLITNILVAVILAGLGVYMIRELEKRLEIELF